MDTIIQVLRFAFLVTFPLKLYLHVQIARGNGRTIYASGIGSPPELFWFYLKPVSDDYLYKRKICNVLQAVNIVIILSILL